MARWQLWIRRVGETAPTKLWDGADTSVVFNGRDYEAALGHALRTASDAVLRDTTTTVPPDRAAVLFTRGTSE